MTVPYAFGAATSAIPLSQLDSNFNTPITLGNTAIQLGNTVTTLNNMTLANVTINSVSTPITADQGGTGLVSITANGVMVGNGTGSITTVSPGTNGNVLTSNGTVWVSQAPAAATGNVTLGNTTISLGGTASNVGNLTLINTTVTNYTETPFTANSSTAITIALTNGTFQIITLTGNATITMPTATSGKSFILLLKQDGTGSRTVTWSTVRWPGNTAPTITSTASRQDIYSFFADGTNWYGTTVGQNYTV
jgi:hypothetical protein